MTTPHLGARPITGVKAGRPGAPPSYRYRGSGPYTTDTGW